MEIEFRDTPPRWCIDVPSQCWGGPNQPPERLRKEIEDWCTTNLPHWYTEGTELFAAPGDLILFKLRWEGVFAPSAPLDAAAYYCPYIPLTTSSISVPATPPPPVSFKTRYDLTVYVDKSVGPILAPYRGA